MKMLAAILLSTIALSATAQEKPKTAGDGAIYLRRAKTALKLLFKLLVGLVVIVFVLPGALADVSSLSAPITGGTLLILIAGYSMFVRQK